MREVFYPARRRPRRWPPPAPPILSFVVADDVFQKLVGVGMATAIFVDATIIRMLLVPSVMQLMGRANWWLPGWPGRLLSAGASR